MAALFGNLQMLSGLETMFEIDTNIKDEHNMSALDYAILSGRTQIIEFLSFEHGKNLHTPLGKVDLGAREGKTQEQMIKFVMNSHKFNEDVLLQSFIFEKVREIGNNELLLHFQSKNVPSLKDTITNFIKSSVHNSFFL